MCILGKQTKNAHIKKTPNIYFLAHMYNVKRSGKDLLFRRLFRNKDCRHDALLLSLSDVLQCGAF